MRSREDLNEYRRRWHRENREKHTAQRKRWEARRPHIKREDNWKRCGMVGENLYELFLETLRGQHGRCSICGKAIGVSANFDHDHATGAPRGVLCRNCNAGLGMFEDGVEALRMAADYLESWAPDTLKGEE